ncbi:hypothetical protein IH980_00400 [Patescibacteria group bacterium]|nr:hypothetical protein [Patescibacteria group bacterium]
MRTVIMTTGVPGVGKSTFMALLEAKLRGDGILAALINDYRFYSEWKDLEGNQIFWEPLGETFNLKPEAYEHVSVYAAGRLADEVADFFDEGKRVVVVEAARGAFGRDNYTEGLFVPIAQGLDGREDPICFANFEVVAPSKEVIVARARDRIGEDPNAAPPETCLKYFDGDELFCSSVLELRRSPLGVTPIMNETVDNGGTIEGVKAVVEGLYPTMLERLGIGGSVEGGRPLDGKERL